MLMRSLPAVLGWKLSWPPGTLWEEEVMAHRGRTTS